MRQTIALKSAIRLFFSVLASVVCMADSPSVTVSADKTKLIFTSTNRFELTRAQLKQRHSEFTNAISQTTAQIAQKKQEMQQLEDNLAQLRSLAVEAAGLLVTADTVQLKDPESTNSAPSHAATTNADKTVAKSP